MFGRLIPLWIFLLALGCAVPARAEGGTISTARTGPIFVNAGETLKIVTNGSVTSEVGTAVIVNTGGVLIISGGTVSSGDYGVLVNGGTVTISGGSVSAVRFGVEVHSGAATISGGSVSATGGDGVAVFGGTATISGGTVSTPTISGSGVVAAGGTATISGGTVSGGIGVSVTGITGGTVNISGGTVSGASLGVHVGGGTATISGGIIFGPRGVLVGDGAATISGGSVSGITLGVEVTGGTATVVGCNLFYGGSDIVGTLLDGTVINTPAFAFGGELILESAAMQITGPANQTNIALSGASAVVNYPAPTVANTCGGLIALTCTSAAGASFPLGTTTVTCTATSLLGHSTSSSFTVTVLTPQQAIDPLAAAVEALAPSPLNAGQAQALTSKVEAALQKLQQGNTQAAIQQLQACIHQVQALLNAGTLSAAQGQALIDAAQTIIDALGS